MRRGIRLLASTGRTCVERSNPLDTTESNFAADKAVLFGLINPYSSEPFQGCGKNIMRCFKCISSAKSHICYHGRC